MQLTIAPGDITATHADAVVNAANSTLLGGGGVDGAIHRRGGPEILAECRRLRETDLPEGLPAGQAVATTAGRLPARWVIHTVGPTYAKTIDKSETLASCYRESLRVAAEIGARTDAVGVTGDSAGGNLAAVVAQTLRDEGFTEVRVVREALAGEDDSEDHEWAVHVTEEMVADESGAVAKGLRERFAKLAEDHDGWYDPEPRT